MTEVAAQIIGRLLNLSWEPASFALELSTKEKRTVQMPAALRGDAQRYWGHEVVVDTIAEITAEGQICGSPRAVAIRAAVQLDDPLEDFERTFGSRREVWDTAAAEQYMKRLRGRSDP